MIKYTFPNSQSNPSYEQVSNLSGIWEIRLKDDTEQSENNP